MRPSVGDDMTAHTPLELMTPRQPDHRPFTRRFRELIAGEEQEAVGQKLGYSQARVSQMARGHRPSREFVERLIDVYGLDRDEWLTLAGHRQPTQATQSAAELTYDADMAEIDVRAFRGARDIPEGDIEILNSMMRAAIRDARQRYGLD